MRNVNATGVVLAIARHNCMLMKRPYSLVHANKQSFIWSSYTSTFIARLNVARRVANIAWPQYVCEVNKIEKGSSMSWGVGKGDVVKKKTERNIKCKDTQIWMNRFEQNGNNESIVAVIHAINVCNKKIRTHTQQYKHIPNNKKLEIRRQGIWRQFACFGLLFLSVE